MLSPKLGDYVMVVESKNNYGYVLFWFLFALVFSAVIRNSLFAQPMADDFCYAQQAQAAGGWFDAIVREYYRWGGRYTATGLMSIFSLNFDLIKEFWALSILLVLATYLSFFIFFTSLHHVAGSKKDWIMWSAFALCLYVAIMPTTSELLYWMAGGITYTVGYSLLLVVLGLFIRLSFAGLSIYSFALYSVLSFALVFLIAGTNEVTALIQLMLFIKDLLHS